MMRISLIQTDIVWENKTENLLLLEAKLRDLKGNSDLVVLPEMFSTGFSMKSRLLAESNDGPTITVLKSWSRTYQVAITGSFIASENGKFFNRAFFLTPEGEAFYYDKKHLFRMGEEPKHFDAGNRYEIIRYRGWNIRLAVCYDLRFPVWLRNKNNEYDLLIVVASWPEARRHPWEVLLCARAIENQCFVCGVNRVGVDGNGFPHSGQSLFFDAKGECLARFDAYEEGVRTIAPDLDSLQSFRNKFPVWKDADDFVISC